MTSPSVAPHATGSYTRSTMFAAATRITCVLMTMPMRMAMGMCAMHTRVGLPGD